MLTRKDLVFRPIDEVMPRRVFRFKMELGEQGVRDTLTILGFLNEEARADPLVHKVSWKLTNRYTPEQHRERVDAIFRYVQAFQRDPRRKGRFPGVDAGLVWRPDPDGVELIYDVQGVLHNGGGDCEELVLVLASLLTIAGYKTEFVVISRRPDREFHHIMLRIPVGQRALYLDPSLGNPSGTIPSNITRAWIATTTLGYGGTVDIWEVPPETIRGEQTVAASATFGEQPTMGTCGTCMSPSVMGTMGAVSSPGLGISINPLNWFKSDAPAAPAPATVPGAKEEGPGFWATAWGKLKDEASRAPTNLAKNKDNILAIQEVAAGKKGATPQQQQEARQLLIQIDKATGGGGPNWLLIGGIAAGVVVIGGVAIIVATRRR